MELRERIEIEADPQAVWDLVMDPNRLGEWVHAHRGVSGVPDGALEAGSKFRQKLSLAGVPFKVRWTVAELEEPGFARWEGKGPARSSAGVTYRLSAANGGTCFDYTNSFDLPAGPVGKAAAHAVSAATAKREARKSLARLKALLEDGGAKR